MSRRQGKKGRFSRFIEKVDILSSIVEAIYYVGRGCLWLFRLVFKIFD